MDSTMEDKDKEMREVRYNAPAAAARAFFMAVLCAVVFGVTPQAHAGTGAGSVILDEQFSDNRNSWLLGNRKAGWLAIQGGKLLLAGRSSSQTSYGTINHVALLKGFSAYTLETSVTKLSGAPETLFGLLWGGLDLQNYHFFAITSQGQYAIARLQGGVFVDGTPLLDGFFNRGLKAAKHWFR
jgi:hypothetical protein